MEASEAALAESAADKISEISDNTELNNHIDTNKASNEPRGIKRSAENDLLDEIEDDDDNNDDRIPRDVYISQPAGEADEAYEAAPMSKSQLKKLKRQKRWEQSKEDRRLKRRDKRHERQARRREQREEEMAAALAEGREANLPSDRRRHKSMTGTTVPIGIVLDCQFEKYMTEAELISLSSQVTRCYSDNRGARHPVHLYVSSYGGVLKERNETVLENQHLKWKGIHFCEGDFVEAANEAKQCMAGPNGGKIIDLLQQGSPKEHGSVESLAPTDTNGTKAAPVPELEAESVDKSIVYLTADSPYTLDRLEPNTCYIVGGIIDKNREKGLCYRIAREKNVRTAKLPISEYMVLQHRHVLATNHVLEIMLKWLETGDWGAAFMEVIPTRKGGKLRTNEDTPTEAVNGDAIEEREDVQTGDDVQQINATQSETHEISTTLNSNGVAEVEGDNAEEGLTRNALSEPRWSAPPLELEIAEETNEEQTNGMVS
ncbi:tRNA-methyltransferase-domain-containing protein [Xylaria sp. FL1042]|nr:tRNA-methyltransferase-domain-containing protein [Xylaria sp. FL1042]